ncbi:MAG: DUF4870 domain-containing protein [Blastocatellia bacterium]
MQNQKSALGLDGNVTALIGYIIWIVALILIFIEKDNKFVRFHAFQSVLFGVTFIVIFVALAIVTGVLAFVSGTLATLFSLLYILVWLAALGGIILLCVKSFQGQMFKLPVIGDLAEKWSA